MKIMILSLTEAALLALSFSLDTLAAAFAYGTNKIKIPHSSAITINIICTAIVGITLVLGTIIKEFIPNGVINAVMFITLFGIGVIKLADSFTKAIIKKNKDINKEIKGSLMNFNFILKIYANPEAADADYSKSISIYEAVVLAISLSIDGVAVGLGAAFAGANIIAMILCAFIINCVFLSLGQFLGEKISSKSSFDFSWVGGTVLIAVALIKLIYSN